VIVGPSLNAPLLDHPEARASLERLPSWGVTIVPPVDEGEGPRLALSAALIDAVLPYVHRGLISETGAIASLVGGSRSA
jgi:hypothetical protein